MRSAQPSSLVSAACGGLTRSLRSARASYGARRFRGSIYPSWVVTRAEPAKGHTEHLPPLFKLSCTRREWTKRERRIDYGRLRRRSGFFERVLSMLAREVRSRSTKLSAQVFFGFFTLVALVSHSVHQMNPAKSPPRNRLAVLVAANARELPQNPEEPFGRLERVSIRQGPCASSISLERLCAQIYYSR